MESLARKHKFIQRKSRLDATNFLAMIMFSNQPFGQVSLEDLANDFCEQRNITISKQAIQERFNDYAVGFMQSLLKEQLSRQLSIVKDPSAYKNFNRVRVKDSTRYTLPKEYASVYKGHGGAGGPSQISIQYEYDMITGEAMLLELTSASRNDQQDSKETLNDIQKGDLLIRDLAYATQSYIKHVTNKEAYYLNRLNPKWLIYDYQNKPIDFSKISKKLKKYCLPVMEIDILIGVGKELIPSRLIVSRVDEKTYKKRINKAQKESKRRGYQVSDAYKTSAMLNLFITNIPRQCLSAEQVRATYSLRWQIELIFKVWKSQVHINKVKTVKIQRFQCELIARLIWILLHWQAMRLIQQQMKGRSSIWKFYKVACRLSFQLRQVLIGQKPVIEWFKQLIHLADKKYYTEVKKGKPDNLQVLNSLLA